MSVTSESATHQTPARDAIANPSASQPLDPGIEIAAHTPGKVQVIRRNGQVTHFDPSKIMVAMTKAFLAVEGGSAATSSRIHDRVRELAEQVSGALTRRLPGGGTVHIEDIQDQVELALMRAGEHKVARDYVLYREARARERAEKAAASHEVQEAHPLRVTLADGSTRPLDVERMRRLVDEACRDLDAVDAQAILADTLRNLFDGVREADVSQALVMSARALIEREPQYSQVAARLLLDIARREALGFLDMAAGVETQADLAERYADYFSAYIKRAADLEHLDQQLSRYDLKRLGAALRPERDLQFNYLGLQTLYDRYFIHTANGIRFELPQAFFMRVAMGLAINEIDREDRAIEFYELLSSFDFMCSTPTLFNSGSLRPQLSSCFLTTVPDDLDGIYSAIKDNALLSKFAGGLGNDWTRVRGMGAHIKGTNGKSQGVVPFMKVANDTAVAVNQGGKRRGAVCGYLETWHVDIEEFLDLRKNTGDDRRRTHDMNTANWVPDLFMKRVAEDQHWTLFSPNETPDLHDLTGQAFEQAYVAYEARAERGEMKVSKRLKAVDLWRKMLAMLFETGHPWIAFKDPCNLRYTNQHVGVVHSSNLCCIAADQRVVTDRGMLTIGELYALGGQNKVVGLDGVYSASEMFLPRPNAPIVRIETQEGYTHKVTPDHKVWIKDRGWTEAQDLKPGDKLLIQQIEGLWGQQHNPDLSYLMGLIAGDGTFGKHNVFIDIWENDFGAINRIQETVHCLLEGNTVLRTTSTNKPEFCFDLEHKKARLASAPLRRMLAEQGFTPDSKTKVPELVWTGDRQTAAAYLRGLYQADGHIQSGPEITTLVLASKDLQFIQDIQILWANFGVKASINQMRERELKPMPDGHGGTKEYWSNPLYRLLITSVKGCRIAEEVTQLAANKETDAAAYHLRNIEKPGYAQKLWANFTRCVELPNEDAYCLTVDSETHAWTVNGMVTKNTEITLHTNDQEIAVCNLGSINLAAHVTDKGLDTQRLRKTVTTAMRMLDNVIDYNFYNVPQARKSNLRHRPVGLGIMGFQDALYKVRIPYASPEAVAFADQSLEYLSYYAIEASSELAAERGRYQSFDGSLWSQGLLPIDSIRLLEEGRGGYLQMDSSQTLDWDSLRERVKTVGMRNSNCMAIAPTATISNIVGVSQSIEPTYQNLFVKSNLSGEFTIVNPYLVDDLKERGLWDSVMVNDLKYFDGSVQQIDRIPDELKQLYATAFEVDARWLVEAGSRRQKWLDQAQSLNLYLKEPNGKKLDNLYKLAWVRGLKTTYYLRSMGATHVEKSTMADASKANRLSAVGGNYISMDGGKVSGKGNGAAAPSACSILDPECEACQ
ncbi:ribonucleoside-diphosphate reductase subunit alpha [Thiocystis violacea]|uniref:ribonucleoside-diphosphate reductase subunit alpha n=1 Tax=Thiocystis violacea TaxID=13725 RepID=UPI001A90E258|nr:ribonucleoside-diphosphate reductase subunit alpha [Thiocystis violacea]MBK1720162.1 ribonucleoside-diphosphate reductase [Thiocystis violacea]